VLFTVIRTSYEGWKDSVRRGKKRGPRYNATVRQVGVICGMIAPDSQEAERYEVLPKSFRHSLNHYVRLTAVDGMEVTRSEYDIFDPLLSSSMITRRLIVECVRSHYVDLAVFATKHMLDPQRVRRAADSLQMIRVQRGFGADKAGLYTLPEEWELDFETSVDGEDSDGTSHHE